MILVTGGYGCIGAELIKWLLRNTDEQVLLGSRIVTAARTERTFHDVDCSKLNCVSIDVSDQNQINGIFAEHNIDRIAHLGALQTPDCNANKDMGMQINLGGTQKLLETVRRTGPDKLKRFVFASSIGVYGPRDTYDADRVHMLAEPNPVNVYGVWKLASENILKLFSEESGVACVSLRPGVLFGPGRDLGLTSTPTMALKAIALGVPYQIPFQSKQDYLYAPDVGAAFGISLMEPFDGYGAFTLPAVTLAMSDVVETMRQAAAEAGLEENFKVTFGDQEVPFICDLEFQSVCDVFPGMPRTDFRQAMVESLRVYVDHVERGWITPQDIG